MDRIQSPAHPTLRVRGERVGELNPNRAQLRFPYSVGRLEPIISAFPGITAKRAHHKIIAR